LAADCVITTTKIEGLKPFITGKVRDVYDLGNELLVIATDRISAFDVILPNGIPDKGKVLTQLSLFWFDLTKEIIDNHLITAKTDEIVARLAKVGVPNAESYASMLDGRSMLVRKTKPYPIECVVRGYISGSAWKEYKAQCAANPDAQSVTVCGIDLPKGLKESDKLPTPIFTPSTKATEGHDINIDTAEMKRIIGEGPGEELLTKSLKVYQACAEYAASRGIIIADTKFELGVIDGKTILIDEVLTPDSSRFWEVAVYQPGGSQPSYDKQFVRDWLESIQWSKEPPAPELPQDIIEKTAEKYREAYRRIVGKDMDI
jgi:phosphoribosylaminoimidazole-succinocarboxamide synthase